MRRLGAAQTANTIGSPVRSSQSRPRSWCGVGSSNADFSAASPISSFASASSPSGTWRASGSSTFVSTTDVADSGVTATVRIRSSGSFEIELDRVDRALRRDAEPRQQEQRVGIARVLDRRDRRRVDLAGDEPPVQLGRDAGDLLVLGVDAEEDRRHVRVRDAAERGSRAAAAPRRAARCRACRAAPGSGRRRGRRGRAPRASARCRSSSRRRGRSPRGRACPGRRSRRSGARPARPACVSEIQ